MVTATAVSKLKLSTVMKPIYVWNRKYFDVLCILQQVILCLNSIKIINNLDNNNNSLSL